jgi:hypothetical protein
LRPILPEQRPWVETERVADAPEIELRILILPRSQPTLAEIVFPESMTIDRAKQFVFRELQELAVHASGHSLRWVEDPGQLVLRLTPHRCRHDLSVPLEPGVCEMLGAAEPQALPAAWQSCCVAFDRTAGWHRPRAEAWVQQYLGLRDLGRTAYLDTLPGLGTPLADFLSGLLNAVAPGGSAGAAGAGAEEPKASGPQAAVEFVAVPPLRGERPRAKGERGRGSAPSSLAPLVARLKAGAGLELDLADPRQRDRLPAELRAGLPSQGFVNYPEAQAVVRTLTSLTAELAARATTGQRPGRSAFAILALYPAQAELICRMLRQVPALAGLEDEVGVPAAFRQREAEVVLLSLTRSHAHRAVVFGDGPQALTRALTRARTRLILFGDPGTLVRRARWEGPLDHLDAVAAARERELLTHLLAYLHGGGPYPRAFCLRQSSS